MYEENYQLYIDFNGNDGNTFFESIFKALHYNNPKRYELLTNSAEVRSEISNIIKSDKYIYDEFVDKKQFSTKEEYVRYISSDNTFIIGQPEIQVSCNLYRCQINVISYNEDTNIFKVENYKPMTGYNDFEITLFYLSDSNTYHNIFEKKLNIENDNLEELLFNDEDIVNQFINSNITDPLKEQNNSELPEWLDVDDISENSNDEDILSVTNDNLNKEDDVINENKKTKEQNFKQTYDKFFEKINVPGNGTCFYYAVVYHLLELEEQENKMSTVIPNREALFPTKVVKDTKENCRKALLLRDGLYNFYKSHLLDEDFSPLFRENLGNYGLYEINSKYFESRKKRHTKDTIDNKLSVLEFVEEIKPTTENRDCNTNLWATEPDIIAVNEYLFEKLNKILVIYNSNNQKFYTHPYQLAISEGGISEEKFYELYKEPDCIFVYYNGNDHYDTLKKKDISNSYINEDELLK